jgi:hypothetical protein
LLLRLHDCRLPCLGCDAAKGHPRPLPHNRALNAMQPQNNLMPNAESVQLPQADIYPGLRGPAAFSATWALPPPLPEISCPLPPFGIRTPQVAPGLEEPWPDSPLIPCLSKQSTSTLPVAHLCMVRSSATCHARHLGFWKCDRLLRRGAMSRLLQRSRCSRSLAYALGRP